MKQCPQCRTTYGDELNFCLSDGTPLLAIGDPEATVIRKPRQGSQAETVPQFLTPAPAARAGRQYLVYGLIIILTALTTGGVAFLIYQRANNGPRPSGNSPNPATANTSPAPEPTASPTPTPTPTVDPAYAHMAAEHRTVLQDYLADNPGWRPAAKADALIGIDKDAKDFVNSELRALKHHPFYVSDDFNRDRNKDFAAILIRKTNGGHKYAVVIFNGPYTSAGKISPTYYSEELEQGDWLFWMKNDEFGNRFIIGPPASDAGYILKAQGNKYIVEAGVEEEE